MHLASSYFYASNQAELVDALIAAGADINARDKRGATPLFRAAGTGCSACVARLLAAGADVSALDLRGRNVLHTANAETLPALLKAGASPLVRDTNGNLPLHTNVDAHLLAPGVNVRNNFGFTPLHFAALSGNDKAVAWLLTQGADSAAASTKDYPFQEGVLAEQFDPTLTLESGMRPYDIAKWQHDRTKWSTGKFRLTLELLDAATPRRNWWRR